jgi:MraZ protein
LPVGGWVFAHHLQGGESSPLSSNTLNLAMQSIGQFSGEYECKLDVKGRIALPARLRSRLPETDQTLWLMRGFEPCLVLYTAQSWQPVYDQVAKLNEFTEAGRRFQRSFLRGATDTELDSAGRLLVPKTMLEHAALQADVLAVGISNRIELWEPTQYLKYITSDSATLSAEAEQILGHDLSSRFILPIQRN